MLVNLLKLENQKKNEKIEGRGNRDHLRSIFSKKLVRYFRQNRQKMTKSARESRTRPHTRSERRS